MKCRIQPIELKLRRDFIVAGGKAKVKLNHIFVLEGCGLGEAAGSVHYGASADEIENDLQMAAVHLSNVGAEDFEEELGQIGQKLCAPARCAISTAWLDWKARQRGVTLYEELRLDQPKALETSITVSVGDSGSLTEQIDAGYRHIKIKMDQNAESNRKTIETIDASRGTDFRIDANGSWNFDDAREIVTSLNSEKVELIEQPFTADRVDEWKRLREICSIPLFMDESIVDAEDVKRVAEYVDGVNIKIQKTGELQKAREALLMARSLGIKTMIGCMIESSVSIFSGGFSGP